MKTKLGMTGMTLAVMVVGALGGCQKQKCGPTVPEK